MYCDKCSLQKAANPVTFMKELGRIQDQLRKLERNARVVGNPVPSMLHKANIAVAKVRVAIAEKTGIQLR